MLEYIMFFAMAAAILIFAIMVVFNRNPVNSALFLVLVFVVMAGFYWLLQAEFVAVIQVMVYAGAVMVLFLFVTMMLNLEDEQKEWLKGHKVQKALGIILALAIFPAMALAVSTGFNAVTKGPVPLERISEMGNTKAVAGLLFTKYVLPFELTSVLLLAAMVGVAYLTGKVKKD